MADVELKKVQDSKRTKQPSSEELVREFAERAAHQLDDLARANGIDVPMRKPLPLQLSAAALHSLCKFQSNRSEVTHGLATGSSLSKEQRQQLVGKVFDISGNLSVDLSLSKKGPEAHLEPGQAERLNKLFDNASLLMKATQNAALSFLTDQGQSLQDVGAAWKKALAATDEVVKDPAVKRLIDRTCSVPPPKLASRVDRSGAA